MRRLFPPAIWTASQQPIVFGFAVLLIAYVLLLRWIRPATIPNPPPPDGTRAAELQDRIDPNTADEATLAALPTLGSKRAAEIVRYRQTHPGERPFRSPRDLLKLKGFGVSTMENLQPYLVFPGGKSR